MRGGGRGEPEGRAGGQSVSQSVGLRGPLRGSPVRVRGERGGGAAGFNSGFLRPIKQLPNCRPNAAGQSLRWEGKGTKNNTTLGFSDGVRERPVCGRGCSLVSLQTPTNLGSVTVSRGRGRLKDGIEIYCVCLRKDFAFRCSLRPRRLLGRFGP